MNFFGFETIRNSTALKQLGIIYRRARRFETIRNSTALKLALCCIGVALVLKPFETAQL